MYLTTTSSVAAAGSATAALGSGSLALGSGSTSLGSGSVSTLPFTGLNVFFLTMFALTVILMGSALLRIGRNLKAPRV